MRGNLGLMLSLYLTHSLEHLCNTCSTFFWAQDWQLLQPFSSNPMHLMLSIQEPERASPLFDYDSRLRACHSKSFDCSPFRASALAIGFSTGAGAESRDLSASSFHLVHIPFSAITRDDDQRVGQDCPLFLKSTLLVAAISL